MENNLGLFSKLNLRKEIKFIEWLEKVEIGSKTLIWNGNFKKRKQIVEWINP